jgi:hypothetical protein
MQIAVQLAKFAKAFVLREGLLTMPVDKHSRILEVIVSFAEMSSTTDILFSSFAKSHLLQDVELVSFGSLHYNHLLRVEIFRLQDIRYSGSFVFIE